MEGEQFDMKNAMTIGDMKAFFTSLPKEMDGMEVTFVMEYPFTNWITSIQSGHSGGGLVVMWAARKLLDHMKDNSRWRADFQTACVVMRRDGVAELRFGNVTEPLGLWWEKLPKEATQLQLLPKLAPSKKEGPSIRSRWQTPGKIGPDDSAEPGIVKR